MKVSLTKSNLKMLREVVEKNGVTLDHETGDDLRQLCSKGLAEWDESSATEVIGVATEVGRTLVKKMFGVDPPPPKPPPKEEEREDESEAEKGEDDMPKTKEKPKPKPAPLSPKEWAKAKDAELAKKYPHYVRGSVAPARNGERKASAKIECQECSKERTVFTSDIFQVKLCKECRDAAKAPKAKGKKKSKK